MMMQRLLQGQVAFVRCLSTINSLYCSIAHAVPNVSHIKDNGLTAARSTPS